MAGATGTVVFSNKYITVLSTATVPAFTDYGSPSTYCAPGDTTGSGHPCYVGAYVTTNSSIVALTPLSISP